MTPRAGRAIDPYGERRAPRHPRLRRRRWTGGGRRPRTPRRGWPRTRHLAGSRAAPRPADRRGSLGPRHGLRTSVPPRRQRDRPRWRASCIATSALEMVPTAAVGRDWRRRTLRRGLTANAHPAASYASRRRAGRSGSPRASAWPPDLGCRATAGRLDPDGVRRASRRHRWRGVEDGDQEGSASSKAQAGHDGERGAPPSTCGATTGRAVGLTSPSARLTDLASRETARPARFGWRRDATDRTERGAAAREGCSDMVSIGRRTEPGRDDAAAGPRRTRRPIHARAPRSGPTPGLAPDPGSGPAPDRCTAGASACPQASTPRRAPPEA